MNIDASEPDLRQINEKYIYGLNFSAVLIAKPTFERRKNSKSMKSDDGDDDHKRDSVQASQEPGK
jgi:hypothetical protein